MQAKAGFDYQDTVTLLVMLEHFKDHEADARIRPEGSDDLVLAWTEAGLHHETFIQIKKPKTDALGNRKPESWSLSEVAKSLIVPTLTRSAEHSALVHKRHIYILGDAVEETVRALLSPGASERLDAAYVALLHLLAKDRSGLADEVSSSSDKKALTQWHPPPANPGQARTALWDSCEASIRQFLRTRGIPSVKLANYRHDLEALDCLLPRLLAQMEFRESYGSEQDVTNLVCRACQEFFGLSAPVVSDTLFRNLRGFISDIAKIPDRGIDRQELELELRCVWPEMVLVREPPPRDPAYAERPHVIQKLNDASQGTALEVLGISGSGKTLLASEWLLTIERGDRPCWAMYIQARPIHRLRDILAGFAFRLRRYGVLKPFEVITRSEQTDEATLEALAVALSSLPQEVVLLVDFIEGRGNDGLYQDLARLIRRLSGNQLHFAFFAQEQVLPHLSVIERQMQGVECFEPPGLQFEEFIEFVSRLHLGEVLDRPLYWSLFERASGHRTSGLLPGIADTLARASGTTLLTIQQSPASNLIGVAERQRFERVQRKTAAEKLLCFILPFRPRDAQQLFPGEPILAAIDEMRSLGLLLPHDAEHVEMHQAVRDRLEKELAPDLLRETHQLLASYYQESGQIVAAVSHFERAGATDAACNLARKVYLRGEHQWELQEFIRKHRLLSATEIAERLTSGSDGASRELLRGGIFPEAASVLLQAVYSQPERFEKDYRWAWDIVEGILLCDSRWLYELTTFVLGRNTNKTHSSIGWIVIAARRAGVEVDVRLLELFQVSNNDVKRQLVQFLLHDARRNVLKIAFEFLQSQQISLASHQASPLGLQIALHQEKQIVEFLAALPEVNDEALMMDHSVQLGVLSDFVWQERPLLQLACRRLLAAPADQEAKVLIAAMRVLLFLGDAEARNLSEEFLLGNQGRSFLKNLAMLAIIHHPQSGDREHFGRLLIDPSLRVEARITVMMGLIMQGESPSDVLTKLSAADPKHAQAYRFFVLMLGAITPFPEAIPLLESKLVEIKEEEQTHIFAPLYAKIAELPGQAVTEALLRALGSPWAIVRACALMGLSYRRVQCAAEPVATLLDQEQDRSMASLGLLAELASRPTNLLRMQSLWERFPDFEYWHCTMIGRLRAVEAATVLVQAATDPTKPWEVRRAAILAAGRLPYEVALAHIVAPVMREHSSLPGDKASLIAHSLLVTLLSERCQDIVATLQSDQDSFVDIWSHIYDRRKAQRMDHWGDEPLGVDAVTWLYTRLKQQETTESPNAILEVLNELHIPILQSAVLRALYLAGHSDVLEKIALETQEEWLLIRALVVHNKVPGADKTLPKRACERAEQASWPISLRLSRVVSTLSGEERPAPPVPAPIGGDTNTSQPFEAHTVACLTYSDVLTAIHDGKVPDAKRIVLSVHDKAEFRDLVTRLDPRHDDRLEYLSVPPRPVLNREGITVHGVRAVMIPQHATVRKRLRPLLAASNVFGIEIPWHRPLLAPSLQPSEYAKDYLQHVGILGQSEVFVRDLEKNGDHLLVTCCHQDLLLLVRPLINELWIPALMRFSAIGPTDLLHSVCSAASHITTPAIDPVLASAFRRWLAWFDRQEKRPQHTEHPLLWNTFHFLSKHPRFEQVLGHEQRLIEIYSLNLAAHHKQEIIEYLRHRTASYIFIEQQLIRATSFEGYYFDEVDKLDSAADELFNQTN